MSDLAAHANATSAGYARIQIDYGSGKSPRYVSRYEKPIVGEPGSSGGLLKASGNSDISQVDADTKALAALNNQRLHRWGAGASVNSGSKGGSLTIDLS